MMLSLPGIRVCSRLITVPRPLILRAMSGIILLLFYLFLLLIDIVKVLLGLCQRVRCWAVRKVLKVTGSLTLRKLNK